MAPASLWLPRTGLPGSIGCAEDLQARACQHVARNLSEGEWERYVGIDPYQATCDGKPIPGQDFQQLGITD